MTTRRARRVDRGTVTEHEIRSRPVAATAAEEALEQRRWASRFATGRAACSDTRERARIAGEHCAERSLRHWRRCRRRATARSVPADGVSALAAQLRRAAAHDTSTNSSALKRRKAVPAQQERGCRLATRRLEEDARVALRRQPEAYTCDDGGGSDATCPSVRVLRRSKKYVLRRRQALRACASRGLWPAPTSARPTSPAAPAEERRAARRTTASGGLPPSSHRPGFKRLRPASRPAAKLRGGAVAASPEAAA